MTDIITPADITADHVLISAAVGLLSWLLTWIIGKVGSKWPHTEKVRHWLPEISLALAVGGVAAWRAADSQEVWSWQTLVLIMTAFGTAIGSHSGLREKVKLKQKMTEAGTKAGAAGALVVLLALGGAGCGGSHTQSLSTTLQTGQLLAEGARSQSLYQGSQVGCYASSVSVAALGSSYEALALYDDAAGGVQGIPGIKVDYSQCEPLHEEGFQGLMSSGTGNLVRGWASALFGVVQILSGQLGLELDCEERALTLAVVSYLDGAVVAILEELTAPNGRVSIPAVNLNLSACGG